MRLLVQLPVNFGAATNLGCIWQPLESRNFLIERTCIPRIGYLGKDIPRSARSVAVQLCREINSLIVLGDVTERDSGRVGTVKLTTEDDDLVIAKGEGLLICAICGMALQFAEWLCNFRGLVSDSKLLYLEESSC